MTHSEVKESRCGEVFCWDIATTCMSLDVILWPLSGIGMMSNTPLWDYKLQYFVLFFNGWYCSFLWSCPLRRLPAEWEGCPYTVKTYSPDINPIENLWDALCRDLYTYSPASPTELKTALPEEWRLLDSTMVDELMESMVTQCKLCMKVKSVHILY